jgi:hypothetical protein
MNIAGLHDATLELAIMVEPPGEPTVGVEFESFTKPQPTFILSSFRSVC